MVGGTATPSGRRADARRHGQRVVHCGGPGAGQAAKVCNNMILAASMIAVSEAFVLAESLGLDHQALFDVVSTASGQCWAVTTNCPVPGPVPTSPANRDYQGGFATKLMAKDLRLAAAAADARRRRRRPRAATPSPSTRSSTPRWPGRDFSVVIEASAADPSHGRDDRMTRSDYRDQHDPGRAPDRVAVVTLNRPEGAQRARRPGHEEVARRAPSSTVIPGSAAS